MDQNSALKKEAGIAERKLLARNERIQNLEALLQDADRRLAVQNQKFEAQLQAVKERLDQARGTHTMMGVVSEHEIILTLFRSFVHSAKGGDLITFEFRSYCEATARRWRGERHCRQHKSEPCSGWRCCQSAGEAAERRSRVSANFDVW